MQENIFEKIIEDVKSGKLHIVFCEPLREFHQNLAFCPYREECEHLEKFVDKIMCNQSEIYKLVTELCCDCPRDEWIVVITENWSIAILVVEPEIGKKIKEVLK